MDMSVRFAAYVFVGTGTADEELRKAQAAEVVDVMWLDDVAVIEHHRLGHVSIQCVWAQADPPLNAGAGWGPVTGAMVGTIAGPRRMDEPALDDLVASLEEGTSALVLVGETGDFVDAFEDTQARLIEAELADETLDELRPYLIRLDPSDRDIDT